MTTIIPTTQAPDAKPIGLSATLTTDWQPIIEVPSYEIPELVFEGDTVVVPGVAEMITPLLIANRDIQTVGVIVRVYRASPNTSFRLAYEIPVAKFDVIA